MQRKQPERGVSAIVEQQILRIGRGEVLPGEHAFAHVRAHNLGIDDDAVEQIVQARQPR
jgi:hypothetical protein